MTGRRKQGFLLFRDVMHVILAIVIIVMVVFAFLSPNKYAIFFPLIFLLFSISCLLDAIKYFKNEEQFLKEYNKRFEDDFFENHAELIRKDYF